MSHLRRRAARLATLGAAAVAALATVAASPAAAAPPIPAGGATIEHASLDWTGDLAMQGQAFGQANFFSAGVSKGTEATYAGAADNAEVLLEGEGGKVATWATHLNYSKEAGHHQVVRLTEGSGRVEADGSAQISWDSTFTVDYYGSLAPFTIEDPTLTVDAAGEGELTATLIGCATAMGAPECVPFAPVPDAQIATFSGVSVNDLGEVTIDPDYVGVEVDTTGAKTAQNRTVAGWGAWPQDMVTFQIETGLSSFFYSSGSSADAEKPPLPFVVDFTPEVAVAGASLDWTGNELMQTNVHGFKNYFSAGPVPGTDEATYSGEGDGVQIYLAGSKKIATWATREDFGPGDQEQVVHLSGGVGSFEQFGGAEVEWEGAFSVNFYAGLAPFTVEAPLLVVDPDGTGELTATLVGCEASMANPEVCTPFAPATDVQLATFSGVEVGGDEVTISPDYDGVEVTSASGFPQNKTETGWGAWPQSFVSFQDQTGLSPYFYSAGFPEDGEKAGAPFAVDFAGKELEITLEGVTPPSGGEEPPANGGGDGGGESGSSDGGGTTDNGVTATETKVAMPVKLTAPKAPKLSAGGVVTVATLSCPAGGSACRTVVPSRVAVKIGGRRYLLTVVAPSQIGAGKSGAIKVRLPKAARNALGSQKLALKLRVGLAANGITTKHLLKVKIAGSN